MQIANPVYDVVFKYLMDDNKIAKMIISAIIGEEISELEFKTTESSLEMEYKSLTVYRLDFSARIRTDTGRYKQVIIEIQKAKMPTDIMRFRRYLGEQYRSEQNVYYDHGSDRQKKKALPIISIYFLGHKLEHTESPLIKIDRKYYDMTTQEEIIGKEEFIESLTHNSFVIQIPYLKEKRRNDLEKLLSIFDQTNRTEDYHIMNIKEEDYPPKYRAIIRKLQRAVAEPEIRKVMDVEDEILEELQSQERLIALKDQIIGQKDQVIEEKDKALEETKKLLETASDAFSQNQSQFDQLQVKMIENLRAMGISEEDIQKMLNS